MSTKFKSRREVPRPQSIDANQRYTIAEANAALGQSSFKTYGDIRSGTLKTFRDGRRRYVPGSEIIRRCRLAPAAEAASSAASTQAAA